jgi:hypothetical protein
MQFVTSHVPAACPPLTQLQGYSETLDAERLGVAIAELAVRLRAATYELLVLIGQFDAADGWGSTGCLSCAHWLHWRTGIDLGAAREKVRVARALVDLPRIGAAMQRGELSYSKVRALTRVATPDCEERLLAVAHAATAAQVEQIVRAWRRVDRQQAAQLTEQRHLSRYVTTYVDDDGMVVIRGRLTPDGGAVVQRALEAAADALFVEARNAATGGTLTEEVTAGQRRADALALIAECALAADLDRGTTGDRYQVVVHLEQPSPSRREPAGVSDDCHAVIEVGHRATYVSSETSQRLLCDASVVVMQHGADGSVLEVGRRTRTVPAAIRRALESRDRHCQFPGCTSRRCDAHHLHPWALGGGTSLTQLTKLCRRHHRAVHEGGFRVVRRAEGHLDWFRPDGRRLEIAPPAPRRVADEHLTGLTIKDLGSPGGMDLQLSTSLPSGERLDIGWAIDVLRGHEPIGRATPTSSLV